MGSSRTLDRSAMAGKGLAGVHAITKGHDAGGGAGATNVGTLLGQGSSRTMDRSHVSAAANITFGADQSGTGTGSAQTKLGQGSAGVMDRSEVSKPGITFGADASSI